MGGRLRSALHPLILHPAPKPAARQSCSLRAPTRCCPTRLPLVLSLTLSAGPLLPPHHQPIAGAAAAPACDLLLKLYPLRQPLLSRHATDALTALCSAPGSHLSPKALSELLGAALGAEALWDARRDPDTTLAATRLLEDGLCRLAGADAALCAARLPRAVHALVPQLAVEHEGVRFATGACLKNIINECVDDAMISTALAGGSGKQAPQLLSVLAALEGSLGPHYQDAWEACLPGRRVVCSRVGWVESMGPGAWLCGEFCGRVD